MSSEAPKATDVCSICGRVQADTYVSPPVGMCSLRWPSSEIEHWRLGYSRATARAEEAAKERDEARALANAAIEDASVAEWVYKAAIGEPVSDFAESFSPVLDVIDYRNACAAELHAATERIALLESALRAAWEQEGGDLIKCDDPTCGCWQSQARRALSGAQEVADAKG